VALPNIPHARLVYEEGKTLHVDTDLMHKKATLRGLIASGMTKCRTRFSASLTPELTSTNAPITATSSTHRTNPDTPQALKAVLADAGLARVGDALAGILRAPAFDMSPPRFMR
jgi:hypothetical protein